MASLSCLPCILCCLCFLYASLFSLSLHSAVYLMEMKVHCLGCQKALTVPQTSSGRKARCPRCKKVFRVPKPEDLIDETISTWIEDDVEQLEEIHNKEWEAVASIRAYRQGADGHSPETSVQVAESDGDGSSVIEKSAKEAPKESKTRSEDHSVSSPDQKTDPPANTSTTTKGNNGHANKMATSNAAVSSPQEAKQNDAASVAQVEEAPIPTSTTPADAASAQPMNASATVGREIDEDTSYPVLLTKESGSPHLIVLNCQQDGVTLAFDSSHLFHEGFRASMPMVCAFNGEINRPKLYARPLAFIDRSAAKVRTPQEIEDPRSNHISAQQTPADLISLMGELTSLPKPFNLPMPYYCAHDQSTQSVICTTFSREDGGITCQIVIKHGPTALRWLANVNGVCGIEYALLERDVALMDNNEWAALSDICRQRLSVWSTFESGERFIHYLSDADFGKKQEGLAGLVLTDSRLIYCKYHHRGSVEIASQATITCKDEGDFTTLHIENEQGRTKLVTLYKQDLPSLIEALKDFPHITVDVH